MLVGATVRTPDVMHGREVVVMATPAPIPGGCTGREQQGAATQPLRRPRGTTVDKTVRVNVPGRPWWSYGRVLKCCPVLSADERLCWIEHYALSLTATGCVSSASVLGRRIAQSRRSVERHRHKFLLLGLLQRTERGPGRPAAWRCDLPKPYQPKTSRITDDQCEALAEGLAAYIEHRLRAAQTAAKAVAVLGTDNSPASSSHLAVVPRQRSGGAFRYGEPHTAGKAGEAGSSEEAGLQIEKNAALEMENSPLLSPPRWLTDQPPPDEPPEGEDEDADAP